MDNVVKTDERYRLLGELANNPDAGICAMLEDMLFGHVIRLDAQNHWVVEDGLDTRRPRAFFDTFAMFGLVLDRLEASGLFPVCHAGPQLEWLDVGAFSVHPKECLLPGRVIFGAGKVFIDGHSIGHAIRRAIAIRAIVILDARAKSGGGA